MRIFRDREEAAEELARKLSGYRGKNVLVLGIPRGAMRMARIIADQIDGELGAMLVHKISSSYNPELAIGCVGHSGHVHMLHHGFSENDLWISRNARKELEKLKQKKKELGLETPSCQGRTVIIVDDGIATGATTICAVHEARELGAKEIVLATPVTSTSAYEEIRPIVDEFIALEISASMYAIGQFYDFFPQVTDEEVIRIIHQGSPDGGQLSV